MPPPSALAPLPAAGEAPGRRGQRPTAPPGCSVRRAVHLVVCSLVHTIHAFVPTHTCVYVDISRNVININININITYVYACMYTSI